MELCSGICAHSIGLEHSTAPWVAILDADDYFLPGRLARLNAYFRDWILSSTTSCELIMADVAPNVVPILLTSRSNPGVLILRDCARQYRTTLAEPWFTLSQ